MDFKKDTRVNAKNNPGVITRVIGDNIEVKLDKKDHRGRECLQFFQKSEVSPESNIKSEKIEPGWHCKHPQYGTWFISRAAVAADWKQDAEDWRQRNKDLINIEAEREPDDNDIDTWFSDNISWIDVSRLGKQIARPDMAAFETMWLKEMARDTNYIDVSAEEIVVKPSIEPELEPQANAAPALP